MPPVNARLMPLLNGGCNLRLVKVTSPQGNGREVAKVALGVGIHKATVHQSFAYGPNHPVDSLDVEVSTHKAREFIDALMDAPFFDPDEYSIAVRQPRAIISAEKITEITWPVVEPLTDIYEDLWQYTHITGSFLVRVLAAGLLIGYGLVQDSVLTLAAGLLFIPLLRAVLAVVFGTLAGELRLAAQGAIALSVGLALTVLGGVLAGFVSQPPVKFEHFTPPLAGPVISAIVGVAAVANADDTGERQLLGLGIGAQLAIVPAWFGVALGVRLARRDWGAPPEPRPEPCRTRRNGRRGLRRAPPPLFARGWCCYVAEAHEA